MSVSTDRGDKSLDTSRAVCGTNVDSTAVVSFVDFPVALLHYNTQLFQQTNVSPGILWLRCLRRLDVTVGYADVRNCVTLWSVCSPACQVTTCILFPGQLRYDLCTLSVNLMSVYATRSPSCSPPARSDLHGSRPLLCAKGPASAFISLRLIVDPRSQLRSCHDWRLCRSLKSAAYVNSSPVTFTSTLLLP